MTAQDETDGELLEVVLNESIDLLDSVASGMRDPSRRGSDTETLKDVFRSFHTLKGSAAMMGWTETASLAHTAENALDLVRRGSVKLGVTQRAALADFADVLIELLRREHSSKHAKEVPVDRSAAVGSARGRLMEAFALGSDQSDHDGRDEGVQSNPSSKAAIDDPISKVHEEPSQSKSDIKGTEFLATPPHDPPASPSFATSSLRIDFRKIEALQGMVGELFHLEDRFRHHTVTMRCDVASGEAASLRHILRDLSCWVDGLYRELLTMLMVPATQVSRPLERMVRALARDQGKEVEIQMHGEQLLFDRLTLQAFHDPLVHLLRNAVDHGVETPEVRRQQGKAPQAQISIQFEAQDDWVVVTVADDGQGIDVARVREKANRMGISVPATAAPDVVLDLIFHPGLSTAERVTSTSGRGVGMDIVRSSMTKAGGTVQVDSQQGRGTSFRLSVPVAGSPLVDGLLVRSNESSFLVPMKWVKKIVALDAESLQQIAGNQLMVRIEQNTYVVQTLDHDGGPSIERAQYGIFVHCPPQPCCFFVVQDLVGRQRVLVHKALRSSGLDDSEGEFILGDGGIGFIANLDHLVPWACLRPPSSESPKTTALDSFLH